MAVFVGSIYFNEENEILTVLKYQNKDNVRVINQNGDSKKISTKDLTKNYVLLEPHGYITFNVVDMKGYLEDVLVTFHKNMDDIPYCACRQCVSDLFCNNMRKNENVEYFGISISQDTCPADVDFNILLACDKLIYTEAIAIYRNYTLDTILAFVNNKKFDAVLEKDFITNVKYYTKDYGPLFYNEAIKKSNYNGFCRTLRDLLSLNNFMYDFYRAFDIYPLDLKELDEISEGKNDNCLYPEDHDILSNLLRKNIYHSSVVKYDLDIDLDHIRKDYILVIDKNEQMYLIGFEYDGDYIVPVEEVESKENIIKLNETMTKANKNNMSLRHAYDKVILNKDKYI